ncbi:uncharacterized protein [Amphiura filiformis]|uniref:uncharacterized protein n=1 Tax=Amphiura filiformis TaxID=82378 RepID=UPI003B211B22
MADENVTSELDVEQTSREMDSATPHGESISNVSIEAMFSDSEESPMELDLGDLVDDSSSQATEPYDPNEISRLKDVECETPTAELMEQGVESDALSVPELEPSAPDKEQVIKQTESADLDTEETSMDTDVPNVEPTRGSKDTASDASGETTDEEPYVDDEALASGSKSSELPALKSTAPSAPDLEPTSGLKETGLPASVVEPTSEKGLDSVAEEMIEDSGPVVADIEPTAKDENADCHILDKTAKDTEPLAPAEESTLAKGSDSVATDEAEISKDSGPVVTDTEPTSKDGDVDKTLQDTELSAPLEESTLEKCSDSVATDEEEISKDLGPVVTDTEPTSKDGDADCHGVDRTLQDTGLLAPLEEPTVEKGSDSVASDEEEISKDSGPVVTDTEPTSKDGDADCHGVDRTLQDTGLSAPLVEPSSEKGSDSIATDAGVMSKDAGPVVADIEPTSKDKDGDCHGVDKPSKDTGLTVPNAEAVSSVSTPVSHDSESKSKDEEQDIECIDILSSDEEAPPKKNGKKVKSKQVSKASTSEAPPSSRNKLQLAATCSLDDGSDKLDVQPVKVGEHAVSVFFIKENTNDGPDSSTNQNNGNKGSVQSAPKDGLSGSIRNQNPVREGGVDSGKGLSVETNNDKSKTSEAPKQAGPSLSSDDDIIIEEVIKNSAPKKAPLLKPPSYKPQQPMKPVSQLVSTMTKPQQKPTSKPMQPVSLSSSVNKPTRSQGAEDIVEIDAPITSGTKTTGNKKRPGRRRDPWVKSDYIRRKEKLQQSLRDRRPNQNERKVSNVVSKDYDASAGLALDVESHPDEAMQKIVKSIQKTSLSNDAASQDEQDVGDEDVVMVTEDDGDREADEDSSEDESRGSQYGTGKRPSELLECLVCKKKLAKFSLNRHMVLHLDFRLFKCRFCDAETSDSSGYVRHLREKHHKSLDRKVDCICRKCGRNCKRIMKLLKHSLAHLKELQKGKSTGVKEVRNYARGTTKEQPGPGVKQTQGAPLGGLKTGEGPLTRTLPPRGEQGKFVRSSSLAAKGKVTSPMSSSLPALTVDDDDDDVVEEEPLDEDLPTCSKMFDCVQCDISCTDTFYYIDHVRTIHKSSPQLQCPLCTTIFIKVKNFVNHLKVKNCTRATSLQCTNCEYMASDTTDLAEHGMNAHFICHVCKKEFSQLDTLQHHLLTHLRFKPFQCYSCKPSKSTFSDVKKYAEHMKFAHKGEETVYECSRCKTYFGNGAELSRHVFNHVTLDDFVKEPEDKESPKKYSTVYKCPKCSYSCISIQMYKFHRKDCEGAAGDSVTTPGSGSKTAVDTIQVIRSASVLPSGSEATKGSSKAAVEIIRSASLPSMSCTEVTKVSSTPDSNIRYPVSPSSPGRVMIVGGKSPNRSKIFRCTKCNFISSNTGRTCNACYIQAQCQKYTVSVSYVQGIVYIADIPHLSRRNSFKKIRSDYNNKCTIWCERNCYTNQRTTWSPNNQCNNQLNICCHSNHYYNQHYIWYNCYIKYY